MQTVKRRRVEDSTAELSDDLWLLIWSFVTVGEAALQQGVCTRFRQLLASRSIPRTIEHLNVSYFDDPAGLAFLSRYRALSIQLFCGLMLPLDPKQRADVLGLVRHARKLSLHFDDARDYDIAMQLHEWVSAGRESLETVVMPFGAFEEELLAWQRFCGVRCKSLRRLDLGVATAVDDGALYMLFRATWFAALTSLTIRVDYQEDNNDGVQRLFGACKNLTTLVLGLDHADQWQLITGAAKLEDVTIVCHGDCQNLRPSDETMTALVPLKHLTRFTYRAVDHQACRLGLKSLSSVMARFAKPVVVKIE